MPISISYERYNPAPLSEKAFRGALLRELQRIEKEMMADFKKTTATWEEHKPVFVSRISYKDGEASVVVYTSDPIYGYVNAGTSVRRAVMTRPFTPKTQVGVIGSSAGIGRMAYYGKKIDRPGIKARGFTRVISEKYRPRIQQALIIAFNKSLSRGLRAGR